MFEGKEPADGETRKTREIMENSTASYVFGAEGSGCCFPWQGLNQRGRPELKFVGAISFPFQ
jgi:hypothetical protein